MSRGENPKFGLMLLLFRYIIPKRCLLVNELRGKGGPPLHFFHLHKEEKFNISPSGPNIYKLSDAISTSIIICDINTS